MRLAQESLRLKDPIRAGKMTRSNAPVTEPNGPLLIGAIVPTYGHVRVLPQIVETLVANGLPVVIVDDGNPPELAEQIAHLGHDTNRVTVIRRPQNGGKGAAMKTGFKAAGDLGWSHALQVDADGQHDLTVIANALALCRDHPEAVICGVPVYDASIPKGRKIGREITHFWVRIETLSREISDSMCGFRIYPLADALHVIQREYIGDRMDFDTDIIVHLNWRGLRCHELPVNVIYPEENTSNFRMLLDNVRISLMHTRLVMQVPVRVPIRILKRRAAKQKAPIPGQ